MSNIVDLTGCQFGRLTVLGRTELNKSHAYWLCKCSCGNVKIVKTSNLKRGITQSCGCLQIESRHNKRKHNTYDLTGLSGVGYDYNGREFYFDLEDYEKIKDYTWIITRDGYVRAGLNGKMIGLHSVVLSHDDNTWIDHKNGDPKDNRKRNLRVATYAQNGMNKKYMSNNTSGVIGVYLNKKSNFWCAQISVNNKVVYVGGSKNKDDAVKARLLAEKEYYGEFAPQSYLFEKYNIS